MKFAPEYVTCVLNENFEDAKAQFLVPLMRIHYAHLVMLTDPRVHDLYGVRAVARRRRRPPGGELRPIEREHRGQAGTAIAAAAAAAGLSPA